MSGASLAVSCYSLYRSAQRSESRTHPKHKQRLSSARELQYTQEITNSDVSDRESLHGAATLSRIMQPDDANSSGNVHGGTILRAIGHVGWLSATRFINTHLHSSGEYSAVLVRMEAMDFKRPMFIGDVCCCHARVTFSAKRSLEVQVTVTAENAMSATRRAV